MHFDSEGYFDCTIIPSTLERKWCTANAKHTERMQQVLGVGCLIWGQNMVQHWITVSRLVRSWQLPSRMTVTDCWIYGNLSKADY